MNSRFLVWAAILIASLVTIGLALRILAVHGVPLSESLMVRGLSCLVLTVIFARSRGLPLRPKSLHTQIFRALLAGLALMFFSLSYNWLTASAVAVLANVDVPLLVMLGPLIGVQASLRTRLFSLGSILCLVWYVSGLEVQNNLSYGLSFLLLGTLLLCLGYVLIKKSMSEENEAITVLIPSLAIFFYGLVQRLIVGDAPSAWTSGLFVIGVVAGAGMFGAYIATMRLYAVTDLASAEFPTLISSIVIQPLELIFLHEPLKTTYVLSSIGFVVLTYFTLNWQGPEVADAA